MTKGYKAYPVYKDSGIEWLGNVPNSWKLSRLGRMFEERREKVSDKDFSALSVTQDGIVPQLENAAKTDAGDNRKKVCINDFVINSRSDRKGSSGTSKLSGSVSLISIVLTPRNINPNFAHHLLRSYPFQNEFYRYGKGIHADLWSTNYSEMKNIILALPDDIEQQTIANFLDHETAKIDTLITKQEKLIELLKEKRQAVISHAVTKGLNPDAPMKDSGVEWLGEVPEHWGISKLKYLVTEPLLYGANEAALDSDESNPRFIRITDVKADGTLKSDTFRSLPHQIAQPYMLTDGDILLARSGGTVGKSFIYRKTWGKCCFAGYLIKASINKEIVSADWVYLNTLTTFYWDWISSSQIQATIQNVSAEKYNSFSVAIPPKAEVQAITEYLHNKLTHFDRLTKKAHITIDLMKERKTALISAAVTGKIDVRDWEAE